MEKLETLGRHVIEGKRTWKSVVDEAGLSHHVSLKTHMTKHWVKPELESAKALDEVDPLIADAMRELAEAMEMAPLEVKPLYAVAIRNLRGLMETKPSQQSLINALKAIHEITGMKMEQRLMLDFAGRMFGTNPSEAKASIEKGQEIIELESEEVIQ